MKPADETVKAVVAALGAEQELEAAFDDPRVSGFIYELFGAMARFELTKVGIFVDVNPCTRRVRIFRQPSR